MLDSTRLISFIVFAEELNFTHAAARLHLSQPALHVQVRKLAEALGVALYRRTGRRLELTQAGRQLLSFARDEERRTQAFLSTMGSTSRRTVVFAAGEGTLLYVLGGAVRRFAARRDVDLRALTRDSEGVLAALRSGEAQVGVTALATPPDDLKAVRARVAGMSLVAPRDHALMSKRHIRLVDLEDARLIVPPADRPHRQFIERALAAAGVRWKRAVEASGWEVMLHYAELGVGLAIVNDICRIPARAAARPIPELPPLAYHVLHRHGLDPDDPAAALARLAIDAFR